MVDRIFKELFPSVNHAVLIKDCKRVLHVHEQDGRVGIWYEHGSTRDAYRDLLLQCRPTGAVLQPDEVYCGTAHIQGFVWHVYSTRAN